MAMFKYLRFAIPLIFFTCIIIFLWRGLSLHPSTVPSPLINKNIPEFQLPTLFDDQINTSHDDFIGHVTLLNVWATWCYACAEEHELLLKLANSEDLIVYGLNYKDDSASAKKWLAERGNPYHTVAVDQEGKIAIDFGVYGTPETFVIDKKGIIRYKHIGPLTAELWDNTLSPLVNQLRNETLR